MGLCYMIVVLEFKCLDIRHAHTIMIILWFTLFLVKLTLYYINKETIVFLAKDCSVSRKRNS